jgi:hypothetical protein
VFAEGDGGSSSSSSGSALCVLYHPANNSRDFHGKDEEVCVCLVSGGGWQEVVGLAYIYIYISIFF